MASPIIKTNFKSSDGLDLGEKLITKDYLISVYPHLVPHLVSPELYIWGALKQSNGNFAQYSTAISINTFSNWKQVAYPKFGNQSSTFHYAAIKNDGTLWTWGENNFGQLGLGVVDSVIRAAPVQVGSDTDWKQVSCGTFHTMAIKNNGSIWGCGRNNSGQLGKGNLINNSSFVQTAPGYDWKFVAANYVNSFAIKTNGTLWSWGTNESLSLGLGNNSTSFRVTTPNQIGSDDKWKFIDCNYNHAVAIKTDGTMWGWGWNLYGQLGDGTTSSRSSPSQQFTLDTDWKSVSCGFRHTAAIKTNGKLYSCGTNANGALGINSSSSDSYSSFVEIFGKGLWKQVSSGYDFSCAIAMDGSMWAWGNNRDNQLGSSIYTLNTNSQVIFPIENTLYSKNWKQVSCAPYAASGIKSFEFI